MLRQLFSVVWIAPPQWREGLIVNLFKRVDKEDPGNYRDIMLLSVVEKVFCKVLNNNRLVERLYKGGATAAYRVVLKVPSNGLVQLEYIGQ